MKAKRQYTCRSVVDIPNKEASNEDVKIDTYLLH